MIPVTTFAGKTAAVFGLGASGNATAHALIAGGASVAAWDDSEASRAAAARAGVSLVDLRHADWSRFAALVLAPGVPLTHPQPHWTVKAAKAAGVEVIGDIELFCRERRLQPFDVWFTAITGTNGKSTTTTLIAHLLRTATIDVQMGGNIGTPILALQPMVPDRHYVIECSSFQIDLAPSIDPSTAVLLNITPDHLDRHGTMKNYAAIKERLVRSAMSSVVSDDDAWCRDIATRMLEDDPRSPVDMISADHPLTKGSWVEQDVMYFACPPGPFPDLRGGVDKIATLAGIGALRGKHNAQNALAAVAASSWDIVDRATLQEGLSTFPGLPHRMEEIGRLGRVLFINDSKATNAGSAEKALSSWERDIFWIAGGRAKEGGIETLAPLFPRIARAYLIGEAAAEFAATLEGNVPYERCATLDRALATAARDASASTGAEPVVLLSPACASYDQFKNFEERGDAFRQYVAALPGIEMRPASPSPRERGEGRGEGQVPGGSLLAAPHPNPLPVKDGERGPVASPSRDGVPPPSRGRLGGGDGGAPSDAAGEAKPGTEDGTP